MAVFEVSRGFLEQFVDNQIENNSAFSEYRNELIDMLVNNELEADVNVDSEEIWPFENKEPTQFYVRDSRYHIRIKDMVVDFFENIFTGFLLEPMLIWFGIASGTGAVGVGITGAFIFFLRRVIKEYVVKLDNVEFCLYLQIIMHLREHQEFTDGNITECLPELMGDECNMPTEKWSCPSREQGKCKIDKNNVEKILQKMVSKNIIDPIENETYKIRF